MHCFRLPSTTIVDTFAAQCLGFSFDNEKRVCAARFHNLEIWADRRSGESGTVHLDDAILVHRELTYLRIDERVVHNPQGLVPDFRKLEYWAIEQVHLAEVAALSTERLVLFEQNTKFSYERFAYLDPVPFNSLWTPPPLLEQMIPRGWFELKQHI